jgi:hypothetical protein
MTWEKNGERTVVWCWQRYAACRVVTHNGSEAAREQRHAWIDRVPPQCWRGLPRQETRARRP